MAARFTTVDVIEHMPNLPTEEVFTTPDPQRADGHVTSTKPLPLGTADWQQATLEFSTGAKTEGVVVRVERPSCDSPLCPVFGKVWYDDFNLQRLGAPAPRR